MNGGVFDNTGKILREISAPESMFALQARPGQFVIEGEVDDRTQKVKFDGISRSLALDGVKRGQPINPRIVKKTKAEIKADNPPRPVIPEEEKVKHIKKKDWDALEQTLTSILDRLTALEP